VVLIAEAQMHNSKRSAKLNSKLTVERLNKEIRKIKTFRCITCKMSIVRRSPRFVDVYSMVLTHL